MKYPTAIITTNRRYKLFLRETGFTDKEDTICISNMMDARGRRFKGFIILYGEISGIERNEIINYVMQNIITPSN